MGATARSSRHGWQSRLCGPSDGNSRSHRKQSRLFILALFRTGFTRALMTRAISASYPGKLSFSPASNELDRCDVLKQSSFPPCSSGKAHTISRPLANPPTPGVQQYWLPTCWQSGSPLASSPWRSGPHPCCPLPPISLYTNRFPVAGHTPKALARGLLFLWGDRERLRTEV